MNILLYSPVNFECRDFESLGLEFSKSGHNVYFLSQGPKGNMHKVFRKNGIPTFSHSSRIGIGVFDNFILFIRLLYFSLTKRIDFIFSHLEPTNFLSVFIPYFIPTKAIIFRHHIDEAKLRGFDNNLSYKLTYRIAKKIVCVSKQAKDYMIKYEGVEEHKIEHINLSYDFNLYKKPYQKEVIRIKERYKCDLLLVSVGRFTHLKCLDQSIYLLSELRAKGINAKLILLGDGEMKKELEGIINHLALNEYAFLLGFVDNVQDYLKAADFLIHPSVLESSCVTVKEAALVDLPVAVCKNVGDFNDYILHKKTGLILDRASFIQDLIPHIIDYLEFPDEFIAMASNLKDEIINRFSIESNFKYFKELLKP